MEDNKELCEAFYDKRRDWSKISRHVFGVNIILALLFCLLLSVLKPGGLELRIWVVKAGYIGLVFPLPITFITFVLSRMQKVHKPDEVFGKALGQGVLTMTLAIYLVLSIFLFEIAEEAYFQKESYLASGMIQEADQNSKTILEKIVSGELFEKDGRVEYRYYDTITPFFKKRNKDEQQIVLLKMQQIYGEVFELVEEEKLNGFHYFKLRSKENKDLIFQTRGIVGDNAFQNDYSAIRANEIIQKAAQTLCPNRKMEISTKMIDWKRYTNGMVIFCEEKDDIVVYAKDIARMIDAVLEDEFFLLPGSFSQITVDCGNVNGQAFQTILQFGNTNPNDTLTKPDRYLAIADNVETKLKDCYEEKVLYRKQVEEEKQITKELENEKEVQSQYEAEQEQELEEEEPEYDIESLETPEGAYKQLYQEIFEPKGYPYDCRYNAKGNFYAMISEKRGKLNEDTEEMDIVRTVVYDRISKNEKCQTFVYYETYYTEEGTEYATKFLDFYAVDKITGKVFAGDKHGWDEVANAKYRKATGE